MVRVATWWAAAAAVMAAYVSTEAEAMKTVRVIQARVQGDEPQWDATKGTYTSAYGNSFAEKYRAVFDSVNTASVEGALMFVQAEGINVLKNPDCKRKNEMKYVVFYEVHINQPQAAVDAHDSATYNIPEYSPFVAMDGGACTASGPNTLPKECNAFFGGSGEKLLGPSVGASTRDNDPRALYPGTIWFSYPGSCVTKVWKSKDDSCRKQNPGGLCAFGSQPDGSTCAFTYRGLGYIKIDDFVGITNLTSSITKQPYTNYTEFCKDKNGQYKGVEFSAPEPPGDNSKVTSLPFWTKPYDPESNKARANKVVEMYNKIAATTPNMTPLPTVAELTAQNPPCSVNSKRCADSKFGCKRVYYSQICQVCTAQEEGCVKDTTANTAGSSTTTDTTSAGSATSTETTSTDTTSTSTATTTDTSSTGTASTGTTSIGSATSTGTASATTGTTSTGTTSSRTISNSFDFNTLDSGKVTTYEDEEGWDY
ncbi:hypothetical protein Poli38472_004424 [Pythium oligandrum]|uniref:Uncharacterized protein n=1 Tax=Pythium oligandrum TaxID=41045 RepID=A0A8K1FDF0_PYTOL|nr:hypothetical protein Poli38472_004424 [Pythium oligandrum]|eukprot:TMW59355.1 hypothetical protein Poli38472_004424 [Pythium oligandrum]